MTVSNTSSKATHIGNGVITSFAYTFRMDNDSDMEVYFEEVLQGSGYVVNRDPSNIGGTVDFTPAPGLDVDITLLRAVPFTQEVDYTVGDAFPAETHEGALDKIVMQAQQLREAVGRAVSAPIGEDPAVDFTLPGYNAGKGLMWHETLKKLTVSNDNFNDIVTDAQIAQTAAEAAQAAAEAVFDQFDDVYLGAKATAPTLDNDGNPLQSGAMYFDTTTLLLNVYDLAGTAWIPLPVTAIGSMTDVVLTLISTGELLMWNGTVWINQTLTEQDIATITLTMARDSATGAGNLPVGTTAQRPTGANGLIRYNSDLGVFEGYSGAAWGALGGGGAIGDITLAASSNVPNGTFECDGSAVSRTTYAGLFANIGTTYGVGDGSTTFNIPDTRGEFVRGWDNGAGVDSGRAIASTQTDAFKSHNHTNASVTAMTYATGATRSSNIPGATANTGSTGGSETRPRNVAMMYCIKY